MVLALATTACAATSPQTNDGAATEPGNAQLEGDATSDADAIYDSENVNSITSVDEFDDASVSSSESADNGQQATTADSEVNGTDPVEAEVLGSEAQTRADQSHLDSCQAPHEAPTTEPPAAVVTALELAANHPDFDGLDISFSVWIDGWGEVGSRNPDLALVPASNEKILVAHAANELLDPESTIVTSIEHVGSDLVFRAGGDPSFSTWRAHLLVDQVVAAGIESADRLVIDVSEFPQPVAAPGWMGWQLRYFVGPLSGFMLDDNRWNSSEEFLESPARHNGEWLREALQIAGVSVGRVELGSPEPGRVVATVESEPISALISDMMVFSDNQIADMLVMQLGLIEGEGTLADGIDQIETELAELCVALSGVMDDGSGLSRANQRSAREFQEILRAIRDTGTADVFESQLPVGGVSGTLRGRFGADPWRVQAKTGTLFGGRALSGYATTDSGREAVFSILINGDRERTSSSIAAMDALVRAILRS